MKKRNNKTIVLIVIGIFFVVLFGIFILNYSKDDASFSILEKKWISDNTSNIIDVSVYNDVPVYGNKGKGVIFDLLNDFTDKYKINLNGKLSPMNMFYHYISPSGCEDLVCMYLYKQHGYICIPSTNKKSTELYECVLLNPKNGHKIYIQVKCGLCDLDALDYMHLDGDVYLFTSGGKVKNINQTKNISVIYPDELFKFAFSIENKFLLPKSILTWCEMITEMRTDINL